MPESPPPDRPSAPPSYLLDGRYLAVDLIARGATSEVYAGSDTWSGEHVCVRVLRADRRDAQAAFRRMSERMFGLTSPRFLRAMSFGDDRDGLPFLVSELLVGRGVEKLARARWEVASEIVRHAALAVSEMHLNGLQHGSLRASTLFVAASAEGGGPRVKLLDLGHGDRRATASGDTRALAEILLRLLTGIAVRPAGRAPPLHLPDAPPELTEALVRWLAEGEVTEAPEVASTLRELLDPDGAVTNERPSTPVADHLVFPKSPIRMG
jgi:hypothetical protein